MKFFKDGSETLQACCDKAVVRWAELRMRLLGRLCGHTQLWSVRSFGSAVQEESRAQLAKYQQKLSRATQAGM